MKSRRTPSNPLTRKPISVLLHEMESGERLHRVLGPVALTALGVGATIGAGVFVLTGETAVNYAGPSMILSFLLAGVGCLFAALCYAELASMVPVAGSAYTYAYATLGELVAWVIGWDLVLEYAIGSSAVASGWSNYLVAFLKQTTGWVLDPRWVNSPWDFNVDKGEFVWKLVSVTGADGVVQQLPAYCNLPAMLLVLFLTVILVLGIQESARFNAAMVIVNASIILAVIVIGSFYVDPKNWTPFLHEEKGLSGITQGAAHIFFAFIGFDSISTHSEEAKNPQRDLAIGILSALAICSVLYMAVAGVLTGMVPYKMIDPDAPFSTAFQHVNLPVVSFFVTIGILAGVTSSLLVGMLSQPRILLAMARDGMLPMGIFGAVHPKFLTPWKSTILIGVVVAVGAGLAPLRFLADLVSAGTLFAFLIVCAAVWMLRKTNPELKRPFRVKALPVVATLGLTVNGALIFSLGHDNWIRLIVWLALGMAIYFGYSRYHTHFGRDTEAAGISGA